MRLPAVRLLAAATAALVAALALAPAASADLRSPRLESSCPSGYAYGEHAFASLVIEGCSKASPTAERANQRLFRGDLEINGMLVEPDGTDDLKAWTDSTAVHDGIRIDLQTVGHAKRTATTRLILDPRIGGSRRRFRIYSGSLDLQVATSGYTLVGVDQPSGTMDIPVNGAAALLGLRLRSAIDDARLTGDGMTFPVTLSLGSAAPALMRDVTGDAEVELVDGTGMRVTDLEFHVRRIELPGIAGMRNLRVSYSEANDRWRGQVTIGLGELFGDREFAFEMEVTASTGVPTYIRIAVANMNFPIGQSGIFLQGVRAEFGLDPLLVGAGATATAGPTVLGNALIEMSGDLQLKFEPTFRLEATGTARILPTGPSAELGTGRIEFLYDADGLVRIVHRQHYQALVLGIGPAADINGEGSYATDRNRFDVEAGATGRLELGVLGGFDVVQIGAVVSSNGWGVCGPLGAGLLGLLTGGIGQEWGDGMEVLMGCDLSPFSANVRGPVRTPRGSATVQSTTFQVASAAPKLLLRVHASAVAPTFQLVAPGGAAITVAPAQGGVDPPGPGAVAWLGSATSDTTFVAIANAPAGTYTVRWLSSGPLVDDIRLAGTPAAISATASVARAPLVRPGRRRLAARITSGLAADEQLALSIRSAAGAIPLGTVGPGGAVDLDFSERGSGPRAIVGQLVRGGIPVPGRTVILARYRATQPPRPAKVRIRRVGHTAKVLIGAVAARGAELPGGWVYAVRALGRVEVLRGAVGKTVAIRLPRRARVTVAVRPVVDGRALRGAPRLGSARV